MAFNSSQFIDGTLKSLVEDMEPHQDDLPLQSSVRDLEDFLAGRVWSDMKNWLEGRIIIHQRVVESSSDIHAIKRSVGIIQNCRDMLELPQLFIKELTAQQEEDNA